MGPSACTHHDGTRGSPRTESRFDVEIRVTPSSTRLGLSTHTRFVSDTLTDTAFEYSGTCIDPARLAFRKSGSEKSKCCRDIYYDFILDGKFGIARAAKYHQPVLSIVIMGVLTVGIVITRLVHTLGSSGARASEHSLLTKLLAMAMCSVFMFVNTESVANRADPWPLHRRTETPSLVSSIVGRACAFTVEALGLTSLAMLMPRWPSIFSAAGSQPVLLFLLHNSVGVKQISGPLRIFLSWAEDAWPLVWTTVAYIAFIFAVQFFFMLAVPMVLTAVATKKLALPVTPDVWSAFCRAQRGRAKFSCSAERIGFVSTVFLLLLALNALPGLLGDERLMEAIQLTQHAAQEATQLKWQTQWLGVDVPALVEVCSSDWRHMSHVAHPSVGAALKTQASRHSAHSLSFNHSRQSPHSRSTVHDDFDQTSAPQTHMNHSHHSRQALN